MLVLTRYTGEKVIIQLGDGREVSVIVCDVIKNPKTGNYKVRLGFEAPEDIRIDRDEVYRKIKSQRSRRP